MPLQGPVVERFAVTDSKGNRRNVIVVDAIIYSNENRRDGMSVRGEPRRQFRYEDGSAILTPRETDPKSFQVSGSDEIVWKVEE
jgi:hypothetical protein